MMGIDDFQSARPLECALFAVCCRDNLPLPPDVEIRVRQFGLITATGLHGSVRDIVNRYVEIK